MFPQQPQKPTPVSEYPELPVAKLEPTHKSSPIVKIVLGVVLLAAIAIAVLLIFDHKTPAPKIITSTATKSTLAATQAGPTSIKSTTSHYDSSDLNLGVDYPADWSVNDQNNGVLTITSPALTLAAKSGTATGRIVVTLENSQTSLGQFSANTAVAPLASQKIKYTSPTPSQRAQTYLTAVNYTGGTGTIDAFYITGDNGYTAGQYIPQSDIVEANPLVYVSFFACADAKCSNYGTTMPITTQAWGQTGLSAPLTKLLESLAID